MAKKTKGPSLAKVAKTYKKNTKPSGNILDTASGKRITKSDGRIPTANEPRVPNVQIKGKRHYTWIFNKGWKRNNKT